MRRTVVRVVVACLFAIVVGIAGVGASGALQSEPDRVVMAAALQSDGDATWRVEYRYRLDDDAAEAAFEELRRDIRNNTTQYVDRFAGRMGLVVADAENATGREMSVRNVSVRTTRERLPQEYGVVTYRFEWTGFAAVDGDDLRAGSALAGLFLDDGTTLLVSWPADYRVDSIAPESDARRERAVVWTGPVEFGVGEPRVVVTTASPTPTGDGLDEGARDGVALMLGGGALLAVLALAVLLYRRRDQSRDDGGSAAAPTDEELLTNEERVLGLLEERGGRLRQQEIAEELGWTDAKTSQVIRDLRAADEVETFRLGRENVVALPDETDI